MPDGSPKELELTPDLLDYARAVALQVAQKRLPKHLSREDAASEAVLHLLSRPPKFDPARGASEKTLIYTIIQRAVIKHAAREARNASRFKQAEDDQPFEDKPAEESADAWDMDEMLRFIDNPESRALCEAVVACQGNMSMAARKLGIAEGTVRYRLKMLAPKLLAAGFNPLGIGGKP